MRETYPDSTARKPEAAKPLESQAADRWGSTRYESIRPKLQFEDLTALKNEMTEVAGEDQKDSWFAFKETLSSEQLDLYLSHIRRVERREYATGARDVLKGALHKLLNVDRDQMVRELAREVSNLQGQLRHAESKLRALPAKPEPIHPPVANTPDWDYKPVQRRKQGKSEVVTETPEQIRRVANRIEQHVRRFPKGRCTKADVSAAFPSDRSYLATAYKHLHASNRVRVDGQNLEAL
jgi:CRP-like cAMP-binding protein